MDDKIIKIEFNIWATNEEEVAELRKEICAFIDFHGQQGRKVSARKLTEALRQTNYRTTQHLFTSKQVALIFEYLGEP